MKNRKTAGEQNQGVKSSHNGGQNHGTPKILVVDDEDIVRKSILLHLNREGFLTFAAENGEQGIEIIEKESPDLAIFDVMMPKKDGLSACREIRAKGISTPLILLTSRDTTIDKVLGLDLGADDYLAKPFEMLELMARVKAILRRLTNDASNLSEVAGSNKIVFSGVTVDFKAYVAEKNSEPLELSAREYKLLEYLVAKKGIVVTRDELLDEVWGYNSYPSTRTVDNHVARLRQKVEGNVKDPKHILTVHGVGYKFVD